MKEFIEICLMAICAGIFGFLWLALGELIEFILGYSAISFLLAIFLPPIILIVIWAFLDV